MKIWRQTKRKRKKDKRIRDERKKRKDERKVIKKSEKKYSTLPEISLILMVLKKKQEIKTNTITVKKLLAPW